MKATLTHEELNLDADYSTCETWSEWVELRNQRKILFRRVINVSDLDHLLDNLKACSIQWTDINPNGLTGVNPRAVCRYQGDQFVLRFEETLDDFTLNHLTQVIDSSEENWVYKN